MLLHWCLVKLFRDRYNFLKYNTLCRFLSSVQSDPSKENLLRYRAKVDSFYSLESGFSL